MYLQLSKIHNIKDLFSFTALLLALLLSPCHKVFAHPDIEERIEEINVSISRKKDSPELFSRRGNLYLEHKKLDKALSDYNHALLINNSFSAAIYGKARVLDQKKKFSEALILLDSIKSDSSCQQLSLHLRAQILIKLSRKDEAAAAFDKLIAQTVEVSPDLFLERADLLADSGDFPRAINGIDEGIKRLSEVPAFIQKAIELEEKSGQIDNAIRRIDAQITTAHRKDEWYLRKSQILLRHGRKDEAIVAARSGLEFCKSLPKPAQNLPVVKGIAKELEKIPTN